MKLFAFITLILINSSFAREQIKVGYIEFPPVFSTSKDGNAQGILIDLIKQVTKELNIDVKFRSTSPKRMAHEVVTGSSDVWLGLKTLADFEGKTFKGQTPVYSIELRVYGKKPISKNINSLDDIQKESIAIIKHFSYGGFSNKIKTLNPDFVEINDHERGIKLVNKGRIKYLIDYKSPVETIIREKKYRPLEYRVLSKFDAYFVVSKKTKNGRALLKRLEDTFIKLKKSKKLPAHFY